MGETFFQKNGICLYGESAVHFSVYKNGGSFYIKSIFYKPTILQNPLKMQLLNLQKSNKCFNMLQNALSQLGKGKVI